MNRRSILGLFGAAPFAGNAIADDVLRSLSGNAGVGAATQAGIGPPSSPYPEPMQPRMEHKNALRAILGDPEAMAEIRDELWKEQRNVTQVDPDLLILKSFSPMAKITFQRQRNVERALAQAFSERTNTPQYYVHALAERLNKLMWGQK